jgi:hypothetical protein
MYLIIGAAVCRRRQVRAKLQLIYIHVHVYIIAAGEFALYSISYAGATLQMTLSAGRRPDFVAGAPSPAGGPLGVERVVLYGVPRQVRYMIPACNIPCIYVCMYVCLYVCMYVCMYSMERVMLYSMPRQVRDGAVGIAFSRACMHVHVV